MPSAPPRRAPSPRPTIHQWSLLLSLLALPAAAAPGQGALIQINEAPALQGLPLHPPTALLQRLGWSQAPPPDFLTAAQRETAEAAPKTYWTGDVEAAEAQLAALWPQVAPKHLDGPDRTLILSALWLLAQHYTETERPALATRVALDTLRLAPNARPRKGDFSGMFRTLYAQVTRRYQRLGRPLQVAGARGCRVLVDGADQGLTNTPLGPFQAGPHTVAVRCGPHTSAATRHTLTATPLPLALAPLQHRARLTRHSLQVSTPKAARALERALLTAGLPWVLTTRPAAGGVAYRLARPHTPAIEPRPVPANTLARVVLQHLAPNPIALPATAAIRPTWPLIGSGIGALVLAGALNGLHAQAIAQTNAGDHNSLPEADAYLGSAIGLYTVGAALVVVGALLNHPPEPESGRP